MATTIREMVKSMQVEMLTQDIAPERARAILQRLSALLGNCNDEIREADQLYALVLLAHLDSEEKANRARIRAEASLAFARKREARDTKELVVELIRANKYLLRSVEEEMRLGGRA